MTPASGTAVPPALRMGRHSLTRHLLLWSLGALALVWASFVFIGYRTGLHEADFALVKQGMMQELLTGKIRLI